MRNYLFLFLLLFLSLFSCSNDDDNTNPENSFLVNSELHSVSKGYYIPDSSTEENSDFLLLLTDGEIVEYNHMTNVARFNDETTNVIVFKPVVGPDRASPLNSTPSGSFVFGSAGDSIESANFSFDCTNTNGTLVSCIPIELYEQSNPVTAIIEIERLNTTPTSYSIDFDIESQSGDIINGNFTGVIEFLIF